MDARQLQRQYVDYRATLYSEGTLDDQFIQLQTLQDESNPDFVFEVVALFFQDSVKLLDDLGHTLSQPVIDFKKVDSHVHQFKGSSSSIGASKIKNICVEFRNYCEAQNLSGCLECLQKAQTEYSFFKSRLADLFRLEQQILAAGGSIPSAE